MGGNDAQNVGAKVKYATGKKVVPEGSVDAPRSKEGGKEGRPKRGAAGLKKKRKGGKSRKGGKGGPKKQTTELKLASIVAIKKNMQYSITALKAKGEPGMHAGPITCIVFNQTCEKAVTGSADHQLKVWDCATGSEKLVLLGHMSAVTCLEYTNNGRLMCSADEAGFVLVREPVVTPPPQSPNSHVVLAQVWHGAFFDHLLTVHAHHCPIRSMKTGFVRPQQDQDVVRGVILITGDDNGELKAWKPGSMEAWPLQPPQRHNAPIVSIHFVQRMEKPVDVNAQLSQLEPYWAWKPADMAIPESTPVLESLSTRRSASPRKGLNTVSIISTRDEGDEAVDAEAVKQLSSLRHLHMERGRVMAMNSVASHADIDRCFTVSADGQV